MEIFEGGITALATPLEDGGVNYRELERLVNFQVENGIHGIVALGTTGQGPLLADINEEAWKGVARAVINAAKRRVPVIVGCGSVPTEKAVKLTKVAAGLGADGTLHDTGYKIGTTQAGFHDYFSQAAAVDRGMKVVMYDVRGRGHPPIEPATRVQVAWNNPNARIVKEASGSRDDWVETRRIAREHGFDRHTLKLLSGDDPVTYEMSTRPDIEGVGAISVWSNILPHLYAEMNELLHQGKLGEAKRIDEMLAELNGLVGVTLPRTTEFGGRSYPVRGPKGTGENYKNPEAVQNAAYLLGMIESPTLISPLGFLPQEGTAKVGRALWGIYEKTGGEAFEPHQRFFRPSPSIADRLSKYRG